MWWQMIRQHLTTGVPWMTSHPWPWAESFSNRGQSSISAHQSHKYATSFHSPQPLLAPTSITIAYPFTDIWKKKKTNTSQPFSPTLLFRKHTHAVNTHILSCNEDSSKTRDVLMCCQVICGCTLGAAPWWHIWDINTCTETWHGVEIPLHTGSWDQWVTDRQRWQTVAKSLQHQTLDSYLGLCRKKSAMWLITLSFLTSLYLFFYL